MRKSLQSPQKPTRGLPLAFEGPHQGSFFEEAGKDMASSLLFKVMKGDQ